MFDFIGTEGHGKTLFHEKKKQSIRISDNDGHTDYIMPWPNKTELEAVTEYFEAWCEKNSRRDYVAVLIKNSEHWYSITKANDVAPLIETEDLANYDFSKVKNFIAAR